MIITTYDKTGKKERRPVGYGGGLCHQATQPYEKREVVGTVTKTPTAEACELPQETNTQEQRA